MGQLSCTPSQPADQQAGCQGTARAEWSVAIVSSRETADVLAATVEAALRAASGRSLVIDVIVNGNPALVADLAKVLADPDDRIGPAASLRIWSTDLRDKAHAWNIYVHDIWPGSKIAFFADGYARVRPDAFALVAEGMAGDPVALAGTGIPSVGQSAELLRSRMLQMGGIHGNFFALPDDTIHRIRRAGFRLPLGLYRTDSLITSALCFNLDPAQNAWDWKRVFVHPSATWDFSPLVWYRLPDLLAHARRVMRQAQGELEKRAFGDHLRDRQQPPETLPRTAVEMVAEWMRRLPGDARGAFLRNPLLAWSAWRLLRERRDWSAAERKPELVHAFGGPAPAAEAA